MRERERDLIQCIVPTAVNIFIVATKSALCLARPNIKDLRDWENKHITNDIFELRTHMLRKQSKCVL